MLLTGSDDQLNLTIQVYRPGHSAPVITAPFETVYKEVAKLWKVEFDTPKPKAAPEQKRYTRQQKRDAAALERHLQTEGLNPTQLQQMLDFVAKTMRPIAAVQGQHSAKIAQHGQDLNDGSTAADTAAATGHTNSQSGQSHSQPEASDAMQSRAMNLTAAAQSNVEDHSLVRSLALVLSNE